VTQEKKGLVNRALAKATGANVHDVRVLCGYYRSACSARATAIGHWPPERLAKRQQDIAKYERALEHLADTGKFPWK
jgi:hypothetical protein